MEQFDVVVLGAGAAGMMCAIEAGKRGRSVLIIDHAKAPGEKIRISGGGRCNFTNMGATPANFLSANPKFCVSALRRYRPTDFIALVRKYGIDFHEKTLGQLFCDDSAKDIIGMLLDQMEQAGVVLRLETSVEGVAKDGEGFVVRLSSGPVACASLVVATGGKSIPKMGATGLGYDIARQFGLAIVETRPALVPLTFEARTLERLSPLSGVSVDAVVKSGKTKFREGMLFTHRGLSGPSILQISSYWREGGEIVVDMAPGTDVFATLKAERAANGRRALHTVLGEIVPKRLALKIVEDEGVTGNIADCSDKVLARVAAVVNAWTFKPVGSEGYRTAEVTLGGVDTDALDSRSMAAKAVPGLYFIGEVVDVTGWLGGYNFQWAWASGWCAGQEV
ncbi:aminoacetone oxidase family FAD-binding enzyme [Caulobacter sp. D4A]|uniref:NAD(P)/FAD-dependent oxidoreductase n=1 Tax=unclassified Caulobacter TaxID=2648921 RepID=UPI000D72EE27|nr:MULTISPECIES: NAD(P)/FAD-dependent oxidoreductase [unclassified Caulobacter]PXA75076.1 aminoacetone oxidase family FAD-binding enzyme [Caulobacter sp. D4A]PXA85450.1 aminoacetone oxidase family FAD-binding enzyme [Caulobacter sp. D5]